MTALPTVAHAVSDYLFSTGTWIYSQLQNLRRYRSIVLTNRADNLDAFPFEPIYSYERIGRLQKAVLCLREGRTSGAWDPFFEGALRREEACLLQAHFGFTGVSMLGVKARTRLPLITTFYGADVSVRGWLEGYERLFDQGDLFLVEGSVMRERLVALGCPREKVILQRLGVPVDMFPFKQRTFDGSGPVRIMIAATFRQKKGIPNALLAIERLRERYPKLEVTLVGDSGGKLGDAEEKEKILAIVSRLGDTLKWVGFRSYAEYRAALYEHHIFLSPSLTADDGDSEGGAPVSLIEAQATGMPIVSTRHADIPEVVLDGKSGLLSPEKDLDALTGNLQRLVADPDLWGPMGCAGRAHVEKNHSIQTQIAKLENIYESLAGHRVSVRRPVHAGAILLGVVSLFSTVV
jgi:colanic acid/amylovoran biosynthesis glycosyltransferase